MLVITSCEGMSKNIPEELHRVANQPHSVGPICKSFCQFNSEWHQLQQQTNCDAIKNMCTLTSGSKKPPALRQNATKSVSDQGATSIPTVGSPATFGEPSLKTLKAIVQLRMAYTASLHPKNDDLM